MKVSVSVSGLTWEYCSITNVTYILRLPNWPYWVRIQTLTRRAPGPSQSSQHICARHNRLFHLAWLRSFSGLSSETCICVTVFVPPLLLLWKSIKQYKLGCLDLCLYLEEWEGDGGVYQQRPGWDTRGSGAFYPGETIIIMTMWLMSGVIIMSYCQVLDLRGNSIPVLPDNLFSDVSSGIILIN